MTEYADITPNVHYVRSLRASGPPDYIQLAGEGIDNSFDAGAHRVEVTINDDIIRFRDNGRGIEKINELALFRLGEHVPVADVARVVGRYGSGIKLQALRAGDWLEVTSKSQDGKMVGKIDWRELANSRHGWRMVWPVWRPASITAPSGTEVVISRLLRSPSYSEERLRKELALRFHPALVAGREIILNGQSVQAFPTPQMTDVIDCDLSFDGQRFAHVHAGILVARDSPLKLMHVGFGHRTLMPEKRFGCGTYTGLARLYGRVQLSGAWRLGVFKDELYSASETAELEEALEETMRPILEKCQGEKMEANLLNLLTELNALLPEEIAARPRRQKGPQPASVTGRKKRDGINELPSHKVDPSPSGPVRSQRSPAKLMIDLEKENKDHGIGYFDGTGRVHRVILSKDNPTIKEFIAGRDRHRVAVVALFLGAIMTYVNATEERQLHFNVQGFEGDFGKKVALLLAAQEDQIIKMPIAES